MTMQPQQRHYEIDASRMKMKQILKALRKGSMRAHRILLYITAFLLIVGTALIVLLIFDEYGGVDAIFGAIFLFGFPCFLLSIIAFGCYPWHLRGRIKWLIKMDSLHCINDLLNGYVVYDPVTKYSFGDTFLYHKIGILIRYEDIVGIYHSITSHSLYSARVRVHYVERLPFGKFESITICLIDGEKYAIALKIQAGKRLVDAQGKPFGVRISDEILAKNPNITVGDTDENAEKYARITMERKENEKNSVNDRTPTVRTEAKVNDGSLIERTEAKVMQIPKSQKNYSFIIKVALLICLGGFLLISFVGEIFGLAMTERFLNIFNIPLYYDWLVTIVVGSICVVASILLYEKTRKTILIFCIIIISLIALSLSCGLRHYSFFYDFDELMQNLTKAEIIYMENEVDFFIIHDYVDIEDTDYEIIKELTPDETERLLKALSDLEFTYSVLIIPASVSVSYSMQGYGIMLTYEQSDGSRPFIIIAQSGDYRYGMPRFGQTLAGRYATNEVWDALMEK